MQDSRKILEDYYICKRTPVCEKIFFQKDSFKDKVKVLKRSSLSLDRNPVENMWLDMMRAVQSVCRVLQCPDVQQD